MWYFKLEDWVDRKSQTWHPKGFSPVWIRICLFSPFWNVFPQYGHSPLWETGLANCGWKMEFIHFSHPGDTFWCDISNLMTARIWSRNGDNRTVFHPCESWCDVSYCEFGWKSCHKRDKFHLGYILAVFWAHQVVTEIWITVTLLGCIQNTEVYFSFSISTALASFQ